jgi:hypothetical protein
MLKQPMFYKINCDIAEVAINQKLIAKFGYWNNEEKKKHLYIFWYLLEPCIEICEFLLNDF